MRKILFLATLFVFVNAGVQAQTKLQQVMELKMPKTAEDEMPGTRGACVAWHPVQKKYYAAFAGNIAFPLAVFDAKAKRLSDDELTTFLDTRGLWYNPGTKEITGNAYSEMGWFSYKLEKTGIPSDAEVKFEGMHQPSAQSVGAYNSATKQVLFLHEAKILMYNNDGDRVDSTTLHWGIKKDDEESYELDVEEVEEEYNYTSLIYTGIKGQELGVLNTIENQIELYDIKTGYLTKTLVLPATAVVEYSFNFAYANGTYWLFDMKTRKWVGYK